MNRLLPRMFLLTAFITLFGATGAHAQFLPGAVGRNTNGTGGGRGLGIGTYDTKTVTHERVVSGTVRGKNGEPLKGAIVYLKSDDNKALKSVTVDSTGKFRFGQLSRTVDYKLWAETKDKKTDPKVISQFDNRDNINRELDVQ